MSAQTDKAENGPVKSITTLLVTPEMAGRTILIRGDHMFADEAFGAGVMQVAEGEKKK